MIRRVVTTPTADGDVRRIDAWWTEHRPLAPHLFREELAEALSMIRSVPEIGRRYPRRGIPGLRRLVLRATRHHVYYAVTDEAITILTVWSSLRGRGPKLVLP